MSDWTDELRQKVIDAYLKAEPTPENSVEIVAELAEEFDKTPNGIRMVLSKAEVYVKKDASSKSSKTSSEATKSTRVSKGDSIKALVAAIESTGQAPNMEILDKLTGKAAVYFTEVINNAKVE
jgi:hypothetical protein